MDASIILLFAVYANLPLVMEDMMNTSFYMHYGGYLSPFWMSTIWSSGPILMDLGRFLSIFLLVPLLERRGSKFFTVNVRVAMTTLVCFLQVVAFLVPSVEAFILVWFFFGTYSTLARQSTVFYLHDVAPEYKAYYVGCMSIGDLLTTLLSMNLSRPGLLGSATRWVYLPMLSLLMVILPSFYLCFAPDPKKKEVERSRARTLTYGSIILDPDELKECSKPILLKEDMDDWPITVKRIWKDPQLRKRMYLLVILQLLVDVSPVAVEAMFFTKIHQLMGFDVDTIMTIGSVQRIVFLPFTLLIVVSMKKFGLRLCVFAVKSVTYLKAIVTAGSLLSVGIMGVSWVSLSQGLVGDFLSGVTRMFGGLSLIPLILCDLTPARGVAAMTQILTFTSLLSDALFNGAVPYGFSYFPPLPYLFLLVFWPPLLLYVVRNYPKSCCNEA